MIIKIISFIIVFAIILIFAILNYKKCNTGGEKIIFIFYVIIVSIPIIIYYLDLWNIPSQLNLIKNIDSQNWLGFLFIYISTIASSVIGVTASTYIAFAQIKKSNEDNEKRDKENLRLQNIPYKIILILHYQDVLSNWYEQKIEIQYIATTEVGVNGLIGTIKTRDW